MSYNGYENRETWNVCLWIANDEGLYNFAAPCKSYTDFKNGMREVYGNKMIGYETPDGVAWNDSGVNLAEMEEFWKENFSKVRS